MSKIEFSPAVTGRINSELMAEMISARLDWEGQQSGIKGFHTDDTFGKVFPDVTAGSENGQNAEPDIDLLAEAVLFVKNTA